MKSALSISLFPLHHSLLPLDALKATFLIIIFASDASGATQQMLTKKVINKERRWQ